MRLTPWDQMGDGPEDSERSILEDGRILGFQFAFPDFDVDLDGAYVIGGAGDFATDADGFADALLIGCDYADCTGSANAAGPDSWGRIKASVRAVR